MDLGSQGQVAVVTGASMGIGLAVVRALVAEKALVIAGARRSSPELAEDGAVEIELVDPDPLVIHYGAANAALVEDAYALLRRVFAETDPAHHRFQSRWVIGALAEAAVHTGRSEQARSIVARYAGAAEHSSRIRVGLLHARPLLAAEDQSEACFEESLAARRPRRRRRARPGPVGPERGRSCGPTGGSSSHPVPAPWAQLSPQELHIARLAADGLSNREIGQRVFLSHRTVGSHLYRIYPKFGVASRSELTRRLGPAATVP